MGSRFPVSVEIDPEAAGFRRYQLQGRVENLRGHLTAHVPLLADGAVDTPEVAVPGDVDSHRLERAGGEQRTANDALGGPDRLPLTLEGRQRPYMATAARLGQVPRQQRL